MGARMASIRALRKNSMKISRQVRKGHREPRIRVWTRQSISARRLIPVGMRARHLLIGRNRRLAWWKQIRIIVVMIWICIVTTHTPLPWATKTASNNNTLPISSRKSASKCSQNLRVIKSRAKQEIQKDQINNNWISMRKNRGNFRW